MRTQLLFLALIVPLFGQSSKTTVTDAIYDGSGQPVTGSCTYQLASGRSTGPTGNAIAGEPVTVGFKSGVFTAQIIPTDTMVTNGIAPATTTLNGAINNSVTTIVLTSGTNAVNGAFLKVLAEGANTTESMLVVTGGGTVNLTVTRAQLGTAASAHSNAAVVNLPGDQYYSVRCTGTRGWSKAGSWIVPTSGSALKWKDIWAVTSPPALLGPTGLTGAQGIPGTPGATGPAGPLNASGLANGTYCLSVTGGVGTFTNIGCPGSGGGGGGGSTWGALVGTWGSLVGSWGAQ